MNEDRDERIKEAIKERKREKIMGALRVFLMVVVICSFFTAMSLLFSGEKKYEGITPFVIKEPLSFGNLSTELSVKGFFLYVLENDCEYCDMQLEYFGEYAENLLVIYCDAEGGPVLMNHGKTYLYDGVDHCAGLNTFPAWMFPDGEFVPGFQSHNQLNIFVERCDVNGCEMDDIVREIRGR